MRKLVVKSMYAAMLAVMFVSCGRSDKDSDADAQAGDVYNTEKQGIEHENRDNQFPSSRNDNKEGTGLETGAPSDTVDGDGDTKKV